MLELLHGPDRTANSMELLARICENAAHGVAGQILIVPEQYSHETERALCERGGDTISRYAEVLSFTRLASRVFSVCGGVCGIKWCNDVVLGGRKLCGILTEASLLPDGSAEWLVVGIGVNVGQREFPGDIAEIATSLALQGFSASADALAQAILEQLTALRGALDDPAEWLEVYRARCVTVGRRVEVQRRGASRRGTALDVDDRFGLVVRYENGETETIRSGEVSVRGLCGYIE